MERARCAAPGWIMVAGLLAIGCPADRTPAHQANPIPPGPANATAALPSPSGGHPAPRTDGGSP